MPKFTLFWVRLVDSRVRPNRRSELNATHRATRLPADCCRRLSRLQEGLAPEKEHSAPSLLLQRVRRGRLEASIVATAGAHVQWPNLAPGFTHLSAGDLLREERASPGSEHGDLIEDYIRNGVRMGGRDSDRTWRRATD